MWRVAQVAARRDTLLCVFADQGVHTDHDAYCLELCLDGLRYLTLAEWNARFTMQPKDLFMQIVANSRKENGDDAAKEGAVATGNDRAV
jgi:hypothetical protein